MSQATLEVDAARFSTRMVWLSVCLALATLGAMRLVALNWTPVGLHVDEAQYWLWSRQLELGYFSKPPGIAALIAASTALFGDGTNGIRVLSMLCWLSCSALLVSLGTRMHSLRAGLWAGALFTATPAANLLGLVATTDSLLMLGWIGVMVCASWACPPAARPAKPLPGSQPRQPWMPWLVLGAVWGMTLASKYTAAALAPSLLWVVWDASRSAAPRSRGAIWKGAVIAVAIAIACMLPNLLWNAWHGWPTLQHTLDITVRAGQTGPGEGHTHAIARVFHFAGGLLLLSGPGLWVVAALAATAKRRTPQHPTSSESARHAMNWAARFIWPLALVGLAQAVSGGVQINWTAPVLAGICLVAGIWMANRLVPVQSARWVMAGMLASTLLSLWVAASEDLRWRQPSPTTGTRAWDFWHKTRHWAPALASLLPILEKEPIPVWTKDRDVLVQAAHTGRHLPLDLRSWSPDGRIRHHFDLFQPAVTGPDTVWWLDRGPPPPALRNQWGSATRAQVSAHGLLHLELWLLEQPIGSTK